jgi:arylsulfatase A-like enzyme
VATDFVASFGEAEVRSDALDLPTLAADPLFERRGWSALTGTGDRRAAWSLGARSRVRLPFHSTGDKELYLRARSHESLGPALPLELTLNDQPLGVITLAPREQEFRLVLPSRLQARGDNLLGLASARQREPPSGDPDRRPLIAAFSAITVRPVGAPARGAAPAVQDGALVLPPSSSVAYYLRLPAGARLSARADATSGRLIVNAEDDAGARVFLDSAVAARATRLEADLGPAAGVIARLELANAGPGLMRLAEARLTVPAATAPSATARPPGARPNVIVYLTDTLRADALGAYGQTAPTSPRFDAFAREAVVFDDPWAQASWTRSAVASIFTGLHVGAHGVDREDRALSPTRATLAEAFRAGGYRTGAFVANHLLGGRFGFDRGFSAWNADGPTLYGAPAADVVDRALRWIDGSGGAPFLAYLHTMEPHSPYQPSATDEAPFAIPDYHGDRDTRALLRLGQLGQLSPEGLRFLRARYAGEVRQNDRSFGALLDGLRSRGLLDRTVVVFTADHGEEFLEHGGTEHTKTLYQELVRVPLAIRLPGARRGGAREGGPFEQIDLLPTLLGLAGLPAPAGLPGRDLTARLIEGRGNDAPPLLFSEERFGVVDKFAARAGALKLILNNDGPELWRAGAHLELYDLGQDGAEKANLAEKRPVTTTFLRQRIDAFRRVQEAVRARTASATVPLTAEEKEQLRALGYVR